jgi:hypothetical protein
MIRATLRVLVLAAVLGAATTASAQDTIAIYADFGEGEELSRSLITKTGEPFDVVVVAKTSSPMDYVEFSMSEIALEYPGVFKHTWSVIGGQTVTLGDHDLGEYSFGTPGCPEPGEHELIRIRYYDVNGSLPDNVVLSLRGMDYRDNYWFRFPDEMGYTDCGYPSQEHVLAPEAWQDDSMDPQRIEGVTSTDGILVLNPVGLSVDAASASIGVLKSRFQER